MKYRDAKHLRETSGSVSIESAIVLPIFLIFMLFLLRTVQAREAEILWWGAGEKALEEAAAVWALADGGLPVETDASGLGGLIFDHVTGQAILLRQTHWFQASARDHPYLLRSIEPVIARLESTEAGYYDYRQVYRQVIGPFRRLAVYRSALPDWASAGREEDADSEDDDADGIWEQSNFARGLYFREHYGGNLPPIFRCLSYYRNGTAGKIKSMDLTAPTWQSDAAFTRELRAVLDELAAFEPRGSELEYIRPLPIRRRELVLVIPENHPPAYDRLPPEVTHHAEQLNVRIMVRKHGVSRRAESAG